MHYVQRLIDWWIMVLSCRLDVLSRRRASPWLKLDFNCNASSQLAEWVLTDHSLRKLLLSIKSKCKSDICRVRVESRRCSLHERRPRYCCDVCIMCRILYSAGIPSRPWINKGAHERHAVCDTRSVSVIIIMCSCGHVPLLWFKLERI